MSRQDLERLGVTPSSDVEAIAWVEVATRLIGPKFDPRIEFREYVGTSYMGRSLALLEGALDATTSAADAAAQLLGDRAADIAYRTCVAMLREMDSGWRRWARPASQCAPRWWLVDRPGMELGVGSPDPTHGLAFEDQHGAWWIWDPTTERLHNDTPWLFIDFYYRANAIRGEIIDDGWGSLMFTSLSVREARAQVITGAFNGPGAKRTARRVRRGDGIRLDGISVVSLPTVTSLARA